MGNLTPSEIAGQIDELNRNELRALAFELVEQDEGWARDLAKAINAKARDKKKANGGNDE